MIMSMRELFKKLSQWSNTKVVYMHAGVNNIVFACISLSPAIKQAHFKTCACPTSGLRPIAQN